MSDHLREKLRSKIKIDANSECWNWAESKYKDGYGSVRVKGKKLRAHRVSYQLYCGAIPDGMRVCHGCDNPACINPKHLFLGTQAENIDDMVAKGRQARGARVCGAKLIEADILVIRAAEGGRGLNSELARRFGVSGQQIADIRAGKYWAHVLA